MLAGSVWSAGLCGTHRPMTALSIYIASSRPLTNTSDITAVLMIDISLSSSVVAQTLKAALLSVLRHLSKLAALEVRADAIPGSI
jgi:hypothetical protein